MAKVNASEDLGLRRKAQIFAEGYEINVASALTVGEAATDTSVPVFGSDNAITARVVDNGTLSIDVLDKVDNNKILDVLCDINAEDTSIAIKGYDPSNIQHIAIWENIKSPTDDKYVGCSLFEQWQPSLGSLAGAPNEWGTRTLAGNCNIERRFEKASINAEKIAIVVGAGDLTVVPAQDPITENYGLAVLALNWNAVTKKIDNSERLTVTAAMVGVDKSVTIAAGDLDEMDLADVNAAYVIYLYSGAGVYPTGASIVQDGLYKDLA